MFSPAQLIAEARTLGSTYGDTTLRTFIVGPMCVNSPNHHAVQYGDLVRVGHGLYRLAASEAASDGPTSFLAVGDAAPAGEAAPTPAEDEVLSATDEWFWEGNVQATVVNHLVASRWQIRRVANTATSEHGVDIEAERDGRRLLIEVKGYPGTTYARGVRKGERKTTSAVVQARAYFSNALLSGLVMRAENAEADVVLAFPAFATYERLARRVYGPLSTAGIALWLVASDGTVVELRESHEDWVVTPGP